MSEPEVPFEEDMGSSSVLLWGLSHHDPTGTLRTFSEDPDPKATLSSSVPEAVVSHLVCEVPMPKDHPVKDAGGGRKGGVLGTSDPSCPPDEVGLSSRGTQGCPVLLNSQSRL